MKKTLVIGSTVVDIIIGVKSLPKTQEDTHTTFHKMNLGGCAFNVSEILRQSKTPYVLCSPVGSGAYGDFVSKKLEEKNIPIFVKTPEIENGCCYCFVEESGERTFISHHGAEYLFSKEWMLNINLSDFDSVYICGLEIEEKTGPEIVSWLEEIKEYNLKIFFAATGCNLIAYALLDLAYSLLGDLWYVVACFAVIIVSVIVFIQYWKWYKQQQAELIRKKQEYAKYLKAAGGNVVSVKPADSEMSSEEEVSQENN